MYIAKIIAHILQIVADISHEKHRTYNVHYQILHSLTRHPVPKVTLLLFANIYCRLNPLKADCCSKQQHSSI